ncbi:MAG: porin [Deltaproteobacteria bacterium]
MKRTVLMGLMMAGVAVMAGVSPVSAENYFGEETKGITLTSNESDLNVRIRLQPRFDTGDIIKSKDGKSYRSDADLYMRRVRLEMGGNLLAKTIKYNLTLSADKWEQTAHAGTVSLLYSYVTWEADDALSFMVGKYKLPYSRVSLTSSSKQLLIERPVSSEAAKKVFGKTDAYYQPKLSASGKLLEGVVAYEVAMADGWANGEAIQTAPARSVYRANPLYVARVELSPPGLAEKSKSDAHLGKGSHLTLGVNVANQSGIEYTTATDEYSEERTLLGADLSGHYNGLTAQFEYNAWEIDSEDPLVADIKPKGWYGQAGYYMAGLDIEPVARYEVYDQDTKSTDKNETDTTLGLNWYGKGHSLKVGANWVHSRYAGKATGSLANDNTKDTLQLQAQMYF